MVWEKDQPNEVHIMRVDAHTHAISSRTSDDCKTAEQLVGPRAADRSSSNTSEQEQKSLFSAPPLSKRVSGDGPAFSIQPGKPLSHRRPAWATNEQICEVCHK